jgi:hypothetical protein
MSYIATLVLNTYLLVMVILPCGISCKHQIWFLTIESCSWLMVVFHRGRLVLFGCVIGHPIYGQLQTHNLQSRMVHKLELLKEIFKQ